MLPKSHIFVGKQALTPNKLNAYENIDIQNPKREARLYVHSCLFDKLKFENPLQNVSERPK